MPGKRSRHSVLCVWKRYPWPLQLGDNYRRLNIVKRLQGRFIFDLYCYDERDEVPPQIRSYFDRVIVRPVPTGPGMGKIQTLLAGLTQYEPTSSLSQAHRELSDLLQDGRYDIAIASLGVLRYLPRGVTAPIFGDIIDNDCFAVWRELRHSTSLTELISHSRGLAAAALYQRAYFRRLSAACYVSELDAAVSKRITPSLTHEVIPSGVDPAIFRRIDGNQEPNSLVFEGNMSFPPNVDAACYFATDIFPLIRNVVSGAKLYIVGKDPAPSVRDLASAQIIVTGYVEDVPHWLSKAQVFVSPLRIGAGIKTKVLQAWAVGVPVVATSESTGGLRSVDGKNIIVRDGPEAFAQAVIELLRDPDKARAIGLEGRKTVECHYTWDHLAGRFGDTLERIITGGES